jgi:DNA-binding IclR family transcriptional regulator
LGASWQLTPWNIVFIYQSPFHNLNKQGQNMTSGRPPARATKSQPDKPLAVKTLRKALRILDEFAISDKPLTIAEVSARVGIARPTAYRLVQTLIRGGYLNQNEGDGKIAPGFSILQLAANLLDTNRLRIEALPRLEELSQATGERSNLGILHRNELLYIAGVEKPGLPMLYSRFGKTAPAYSSALGKAMLANLPEDDLEAYFTSTKLVPMTENTITDIDQLKEAFTQVRQSGYAVDHQEHTMGIFCIASAIIVGGKAIAAVGITSRSLDSLMGHIDSVRHSAEVITHVLGRGN